MKKSLIWLFLVSFFILIFTCSLCNASESSATKGGFPLVRKDDRTKIFSSENGEISAVTISDGSRGSYYLQFISLAPNSLFLPVLLHADMVFFVQTGSGRLTTVFDDNVAELNLERGDVFRLYPGTVFYVQSKLDDKLADLRIDAIFSSTDENFFESSIGAYSSITDLVLGFDDRVLESAFKIPEDVLQYLRNVTRPQGIVLALPQQQKETFWELESRLIKAFLGIGDGNFNSLNSKKKKKKKESKAYNIFQETPDFQNCNGWSITADRNDLKQLRGSNIGIFMVNLTKGSMMGPHWNMMATEISIVLQGQGVITVVCSSNLKESDCKTRRLWVKEGDVFVVPRFHPMAQMSFNNNSFVFMGFSTSSRMNFPQFLAGERSVLNTLNRSVLATSFNVNGTKIDQLLSSQTDSVILECTSCAEEEVKIIRQEIEKAKQEEARKKKEEEEAARREKERKEEEEEAARREEERKKREKEEAAREKREEEEAARREKERKEEEEEAARREKERKEEEEEAARKKREEEEAARREKERKEEEEEAARREEERKEEEKQEEEQRQQEEERKKEEAAAKAEEEARKAREEEEAREHGEGPVGPPGGPSEKHQQEEQRRQEEAAASEQEKARKEREGQGGQPQGPGGQGEQRQQEEAAASEQEKARKQREGEGGQPKGPGGQGGQKQQRKQEEAAASEQEKARKQREGQGGQPEVPGGQGEQKQQREQEEAAASEQEKVRKHKEQQEGQPKGPGEQGEQKQQREEEEAASSEQQKARKHREEQGREQEEDAASKQEKARKQKESQWEQPQGPGEQGGQKQQRQQEEEAASKQETARKHREGQGEPPQNKVQ